ncbi:MULTISPECIES: MaoC/PaaZ C-terminal domain-containing protein [Thermocrispum]|jgi:acyl dehydratase|uniref:Dehydratase n=1 Tax=Thermocrispum agreste TaxID=37925 RepID=A0A2W4J194_9PSEU|nr:MULTISPECIES: MaoC/PaaZ C-terminal domain-containing protein [Thermocrispum]PZM91948.1 MAG: dehydratase [Thermocrispum agreste]
MSADLSAVEVGTELPPLNVRITRKDLIRYAGASLDFNPIHWNERQATESGLPGVIAHGMLTMALAGRLVTEWTGDSGRVVDLFARFTRPVVVPDDDKGAEVELTGKVTEISDGRATVAITAKFEGRPVLGKATAVVRID